MIHVHFSSAFVPYIGERDIAISDRVQTLGNLFSLLISRFPEWGGEVTVDGKSPDYNVLMAVNGELASTLLGLSTPLKDGDRIEFHLLLTGG